MRMHVERPSSPHLTGSNVVCSSASWNDIGMNMSMKLRYTLSKRLWALSVNSALYKWGYLFLNFGWNIDTCACALYIISNIFLRYICQSRRRSLSDIFKIFKYYIIGISIETLFSKAHSVKPAWAFIMTLVVIHNESRTLHGAMMVSLRPQHSIL